jgi:hypothetical protein
MFILSGPAFFRLAMRLPAYEGVMRVRVAEVMAEGESQGTVTQMDQRRRVNPGTRAALEADPVFKGVISFG